MVHCAPTLPDLRLWRGKQSIVDFRLLVTTETRLDSPDCGAQNELFMVCTVHENYRSVNQIVVFGKDELQG